MASSSSSSSQWKYDVYVSFRGIDTGNEFTSHLYAALCRERINTFMDEDIRGHGGFIEQTLFGAIEESKIAVIIFSENFSKAYWCLNEVVKIMECEAILGQMILPVFYGVDPGEVRQGEGRFGEGLLDHERERRKEVNLWRDVLRLVSEHRGICGNQSSSDSNLVDQIVDEIKLLLACGFSIFPSRQICQMKDAVFLSFQRTGTGDNFASDLNAAVSQKRIALSQKGIETFHRLEESKIAIIIFSKEYYSSLDELVEIIKCHKRLGQIIVPIFYDVDPSELRNYIKDEDVGTLDKHIKRRALEMVADISGWDARVTRPETKLIKRVAEDILKRLEQSSQSPVSVSKGHDFSRNFKQEQILGGLLQPLPGQQAQKVRLHSEIPGETCHAFLKTVVDNSSQLARDFQAYREMMEKKLEMMVQENAELRANLQCLHRGVYMEEEVVDHHQAASSPVVQWKNDVFLSFSDSDTRRGFTSHLYAGLRRERIQTFIREPRYGNVLRTQPDVWSALQESKIAIVIFSRRYVESERCLDELTKIIECREFLRQRTIPIFYDVEPSDLEGQGEVVREAFDRYERKLGRNNKEVHMWSRAVGLTVELTGWVADRIRPESKFVDTVVRQILQFKRTAEPNSSIWSSSLAKYDVFLSFRGTDTRENFTAALHAAFCDKDIDTFLDTEFIRGAEIEPSILTAIEESKIAIIIFSKNFAFSTWCLDELVKIIQCHKLKGQIIVPIFYHVDPSEVRNQTGCFEEAFAKHEATYWNKYEKVHIWRRALEMAADILGSWDARITSPDSILIERVVEDVLHRLKQTSPSTDAKGSSLALQEQVIGTLDEPQKAMPLPAQDPSEALNTLLKTIGDYSSQLARELRAYGEMMDRKLDEQDEENAELRARLEGLEGGQGVEIEEEDVHRHQASDDRFGSECEGSGQVNVRGAEVSSQNSLHP